jgi:uncharacterized membrane protein (DUF485 family)
LGRRGRRTGRAARLLAAGSVGPLGGPSAGPGRYSGSVALISRLGPLAAYRELRSDFDRTILVLAAGDLVASFGFSLVFPFLTIYLTTVIGASATQSGLVLGLYSVASIASNAAMKENDLVGKFCR